MKSNKMSLSSCPETSINLSSCPQDLERYQPGARSKNGNLADRLWNQAIAPISDANLVAQEVTRVQDVVSEQKVQDNNDDSEEEQYANNGSDSECDSDDDDDDEYAVSDQRRTTAVERLAAQYIPQEVQANIIAAHGRCWGLFSLSLLQGTAESVV